MEIRKNMDKIDNFKGQAIPANKVEKYVDIPQLSAGTGVVEKFIKQFNEGSTASTSSQQVVVRNQLTIEEFTDYHKKISNDMKMEEFKGHISMADIEFYSYDRGQVFKKIWECANKNAMTAKMSDKDFAADVTDIAFIWLVRGTNFERIKKGLSQGTQDCLNTLINKYGFKSRKIDDTTKAMVRLQNDDLTVSRFCDLYPMRVWAIWHHTDKTQRPSFLTHTYLTDEEIEIARSLRCPSLPYLCSKTLPNKSKDCSDFKNLLSFHSFFLLDFDRLMFLWVKGRPNMPSNFKPRLGLICQIVRKKVMAKEFVPKNLIFFRF